MPWTETTRREYERRGVRYASDMTDEEWALVAPFMPARELEGCEASPSAGVIDSQSVKTTESGGISGFDAGKKIKGRKRHIVTDTLGLPLEPLSSIIQPRPAFHKWTAPHALPADQTAIPRPSRR